MLQEVNLPIAVARQLYDASSRDSSRDVLFHTVNVERDEDGKTTFVATDTHVLYAYTAQGNEARDIPSGVYRWLSRPRKGLQVLRDVEGKFPSWRRVAAIHDDPYHIGAVTYGRDFRGKYTRLFVTEPLNVNVRYLPSVEQPWQIYRNRVDGGLIKPLILVAPNSIWVLMPVDYRDGGLSDSLLSRFDQYDRDMRSREAIAA